MAFLRRHREDSSNAFATSTLERVGGQHHALAALPPPERHYPLYMRLGEPRGQYGQARKISPTPGFDTFCSQSLYRLGYPSLSDILPAYDIYKDTRQRDYCKRSWFF